MNGKTDDLLSLRGVYASYGNITALRGISLEVRDGEIVSLIGSNGAGKSTTLMTICGSPRASRGEIRFSGNRIDHLPTNEIVRLGIAQSPEGRRILPKMSVLENLWMGTTVTDGRHIEEDLKLVFDLFPRLYERRAQRGGTLSGGEQQMLAIGRALMSRPRLLLLDEPSLGLAPLIVKPIFEVIDQINRERGMSVFLVEQNAFHALRLAHRAYVLANGDIVMTGSGRELLDNEEVRSAYLEGSTGKKEVEN